MNANSSRSCGRCGMGFVLARPGPGAEITRCAEAGCGRRFWYRDGGGGSGSGYGAGAGARNGVVTPMARVVVGVDPSWQPVAPVAAL